MNKLFFYMKEAFKSIFRSKNTSFATVFSMTITLFILGIVLFIVLNINNFVITTRQDFSGMQIFLKNDVDEDGIEEFRSFLEHNRNFSDIQFVSKEETMKKFIQNMENDSNLFDDINNPCENSFIVHINDTQIFSKLVEELKTNSQVSSISYYADTLNILIKISKIISIVSIAIIFILFMLSLLIIENMIKVTIFSRMREINIMKTIGATNWFIRWPFIIEGAILGFIGSLVSFSLLNFIYVELYMNLSNSNIFLQYMIDKDVMSHLIFSLFLCAGIGIGILGSITSLRKYLKV
ncbi:MAG: permease-like cell division protein FtsX [Peptoanaerobacter stomatis]|uniref:permease-like cell division protein FtsX n=1 Tax=Peptoanaerobacter stomatis TaxID=796937 RepID=UPI003F9FB2F9